MPSGYGASTLDCIGCYCGHYFAIETKAPGKKLTPRQKDIAEEMMEAGARVFTIDGDTRELEAWLLYVRDDLSREESDGRPV